MLNQLTYSISKLDAWDGVVAIKVLIYRRFDDPLKMLAEV